MGTTFCNLNSNMNSFLLIIAAFCLLQLTFASSSSSSSSSTSSSSTSSSSSIKVPSEVAVAVTASGDLITFKTDKPNKIWSRSSIGLVEGDSIVNIDFRPADGKLYAIGSKSNAYTISSDGVATQVGDTFSPAIQGTAFGFDFNPSVTVDKARIVTDTDSNTVLTPGQGTVTVTDVFYNAGDANEGADPNIVALGYSNSVPNADTTQLYAIDSHLNTFNKLANSAGTLDTVSSLGVKVTDNVSLDISGASGVVYVAVGVAGSSSSSSSTSSSSSSSSSTDEGKSVFGVVNIETGLLSSIGTV